MTHDLLGDAADHQVREAGAPERRHDDRVGGARRLHDAVVGIADHDARGHVPDPLADDARDLRVEPLPRVGAEILGRDPDRHLGGAGERAHGIDRGDRVDDRQRPTMPCRQVGGDVESRGSGGGEIVRHENASKDLHHPPSWGVVACTGASRRWRAKNASM